MAYEYAVRNMGALTGAGLDNPDGAREDLDHFKALVTKRSYNVGQLIVTENGQLQCVNNHVYCTSKNNHVTKEDENARVRRVLAAALKSADDFWSRNKEALDEILISNDVVTRPLGREMVKRLFDRTARTKGGGPGLLPYIVPDGRGRHSVDDGIVPEDTESENGQDGANPDKARANAIKKDYFDFAEKMTNRFWHKEPIKGKLTKDTAEAYELYNVDEAFNGSGGISDKLAAFTRSEENANRRTVGDLFTMISFVLFKWGCISANQRTAVMDLMLTGKLNSIVTEMEGVRELPIADLGRKIMEKILALARNDTALSEDDNKTLTDLLRHIKEH